MSEDEKFSYVQLIMPKSYVGIKTALDNVEDFNLDLVKNWLQEEEKRKKTKCSNRPRNVDCICKSCLIVYYYAFVYRYKNLGYQGSGHKEKQHNTSRGIQGYSDNATILFREEEEKLSRLIKR